MIPALCFITDATAPLSIPEQAEQAARGGARWVQLRHKTLADAAFADLTRELMARLRPLDASLIINDRVDLAGTLGVAGVHIGQSDGDPFAIRKRIGSDAILGLSIEAHDQLAAIPPGCVSYLGVGPVRATPSKPDHAPPLGLDGLARIARATALPCMAIGGLAAPDARAVREAGCTGMAVVSAISRAPSPEIATRNLLHEWNNS
jgi:thiamine-phosphate pyrophosphorylase